MRLCGLFTPLHEDERLQRLRGLAIRLKRYINQFHKLDRETIAKAYIKGNGIEIGALHNPLWVPPGAKVAYVDRMQTDALRHQYPELANEPLVHVDILDDGEILSRIQDGSQDFVISNHFLEHCENPILAFQNFLRVLKPSGILYLALPDKRFTFDSKRPVTQLDHLVKDYDAGPEASRREHYDEWVRLVEAPAQTDGIEKRVDELMQSKYSIHFHVWSHLEMLDFIRYLSTRFPFELLLSLRHDQECIIIIQKVGAPA